MLDLHNPDVSRRNLRAWVELLTAPQLRGRHAGEVEARQAAALVAAEMVRLGLVPPDSGTVPTTADYCRGFPFLDGEDYNVIARLPALGQAASSTADRRVVLISAHYDGQGVHPAGRIYPGADDNASGMAALLELARLAGRQPTPGTAWTFVAFGAEEGGQQGSRAFLSSPSAPLSSIELAVNLDMVGRPFGERGDAIGYSVSGDHSAETLAGLQAAAADSGVKIQSLQTAGDLEPTISDAEVLASRLPTLLLSTALHEDHHQLTDTPDRIDYRQIERAVRLVLALAESASKSISTEYSAEIGQEPL